MLKSFWKFITQLDNASGFIVICVAIISGIIGVVPNILDLVTAKDRENFLLSMILFCFGGLTGVILIMSNTNKKSPQLDEIFDDFGYLDNNGIIQESLKNAKEIWLLTRTGYGWLNRYPEIMDTIFPQKGNNLVLVIDTENGALKMSHQSSKEEISIFNAFPSDYPSYQIKVKTTYSKLFRKYREYMDLRVIEHYPAFTLLIINSKNGSSIIYVELAKFKASASNRPVLTVTEKDARIFKYFINEFQDMWEKAQQWRLLLSIEITHRDNYDSNFDGLFISQVTVDSLNSGSISNNVKDLFYLNSMMLSENTTIEQINNSWKINDRQNNRYYILKQEECTSNKKHYLNIYDNSPGS